MNVSHTQEVLFQDFRTQWKVLCFLFLSIWYNLILPKEWTAQHACSAVQCFDKVPIKKHAPSAYIPSYFFTSTPLILSNAFPLPSCVGTIQIRITRSCNKSTNWMLTVSSFTRHAAAQYIPSLNSGHVWKFMLLSFASNWKFYSVFVARLVAFRPFVTSSKFCPYGPESCRHLHCSYSEARVLCLLFQKPC